MNKDANIARDPHSAAGKGSGPSPKRNDPAPAEPVSREGRNHKPTGISRGSAAVFIFLIALGAYLSNGRTTPFHKGFDHIPTRLIPFSILHYGTVTLGHFVPVFEKFGPVPGYVQARRDAHVSFYPIGAALVALPIYVVDYLGLRLLNTDVDAETLFVASEPAEKRAAAVIAAAAAALLFSFLSRRTSARVAAGTALVFALGTLMWATASQQLWQHGPVVLCLIGALWLLSMPSAAGATAAGVALGLAVATRPPSGLFLLAGAIYLLAREGSWFSRLRHLGLYAAGSLLIIVPSAAYSLYYYGLPFGGYGTSGVGFRRFALSSLSSGLPGLLVSPNRGLLIFTPVTIFGFAGAAIALRRFRRHLLLSLFSLAALVYLVVHAAFQVWSGGFTFGPRYTIEVLPVLAACAPLAIEKWRGAMARSLLVVAIVWSIGVQLIGAFAYPASDWHGRMSHDIEGNAWNRRHLLLWEDSVAWAATRSDRVRQWKEREEELAKARRRAAVPQGMRRAPVDLDGDGISDIVLYRPSTAELLHTSSGGATTASGAAGDCVPVAGDFDGDGRAELSLFCDGRWDFFDTSGSMGRRLEAAPGDIPLAGDFHGDGKSVAVVFRSGRWLALSEDGESRIGEMTHPRDGRPVPFDHDGDGKMDRAIYSNGKWYVFASGNSRARELWTGGDPNDIPVPGDYDGDGIEEVAIFRAGLWLLFDLDYPQWQRNVWTGVDAPPDSLQPVPGDYDGDGKLDFAIYTQGTLHLFADDGRPLRTIPVGGSAGDLMLSRRPILPDPLMTTLNGELRSPGGVQGGNDQ